MQRHRLVRIEPKRPSRARGRTTQVRERFDERSRSSTMASVTVTADFAGADQERHPGHRGESIHSRRRRTSRCPIGHHAHDVPIASYWPRTMHRRPADAPSPAAGTARPATSRGRAGVVSIASRVTICSRWFCTTSSRTAHAVVEGPRSSTPKSSPIVSCTRVTWSRWNSHRRRHWPCRCTRRPESPPHRESNRCGTPGTPEQGA